MLTQRVSVRLITIIIILILVTAVRQSRSRSLEESLEDRPELVQQLQRLKEARAIKFLVTGKTGTGKSSLINGLAGKEVATVGDGLDPETIKVKGFPVDILDVKVMLYDSPGLQDGLENEVEYLKDMEKTCKGVDLVLYTIKMIETRLDNSDRSAMHKLTCAFGAEFWDHAMFVLTFANLVEDPVVKYRNYSDRHQEEFFEKKLNLWKKKLPEVLKDMQSKPCSNGDTIRISPTTANRIPILPAGYPTQPHLPGHPYWFSKIWEASILLLDTEAQILMLTANQDRIKPPERVSQADFNQGLHRQPVVIHRDSGLFGKVMGATTGAVAGGTFASYVVGGSVAGPVGALAGAVLGYFFG